MAFSFGIDKKMKTPITYYGGKQNLVKTILPLIPEHTCYVEPFFGGGAVFFKKEPSKVEVINDINGFVINFYKVLKHNFDELKYLLEETLYSRQQYREARNIFKNQNDFDNVKKAWSFWILTQMSYGHIINEGLGFGKNTNNPVINIKNKIDNFTKDYCERLKLTQIECDDAFKVINRFDDENAFFYCDPPYYDSDCRGYKGYALNDYEDLLKTLSNIKGKFLLSSYPSDILEEYIIKNKWEKMEKNMNIDMSKNKKERKYKTEVLIANYKINNQE
jgi:DNA adenine methylase